MSRSANDPAQYQLRLSLVLYRGTPEAVYDTMVAARRMRYSHTLRVVTDTQSDMLTGMASAAGVEVIDTKGKLTPDVLQV